jgi:hypothetical protein
MEWNVVTNSGAPVRRNQARDFIRQHKLSEETEL